MKPPDGDHVLSASGTTMHFLIAPGGLTAKTTFDTFTWEPEYDMFVADHVLVTIRFTDSTHFLGSTGLPPNQSAYAGTYT